LIYSGTQLGEKFQYGQRWNWIQRSRNVVSWALISRGQICGNGQPTQLHTRQEQKLSASREELLKEWYQEILDRHMMSLKIRTTLRNGGGN
jgi:hypothetical protein